MIPHRGNRIKCTFYNVLRIMNVKCLLIALNYSNKTYEKIGFKHQNQINWSNYIANFFSG